MIRSLWCAASGMEAQQLKMDNISNNLANASTVGFKRSRVDFQDLLYQTLKEPGVESTNGNQIPTGMQLGLGVRPAAITKIFLQGDYQKTDNDLDLAIEGRGFFQITLPDGTIAYTRCGAFKLDSEGTIVTSDGYKLEPEITIPSDATSITVTDDGTISVMTPGTTTPSEVGTIELATFPNQAGLKSIGRNLFIKTEASGDETTGTPGLDGYGTIAQGFLEMSNVSVVDEMVNMIVSQRAYEINSKAVQTSDEMLQTANNLKR